MSITGRITNASGAAVQYAAARLSPAPASAGAAQAVGGVGIVANPVEALTDASGDFTLTAVVGFRYRLKIDAIGYDRVFDCPSSDTSFELLGLSPVVQGAANGEDADGLTIVYVRILVGGEATVRERFDLLSLERATDIAGPWAEIESWDLLPGKSVYEYEDDDLGDNGYFYRARYVNSGGGPDYSQYSDIRSAAEAEDIELAVSVDELLTFYLFGVDLTNDAGEPYPRAMLEHYIKAAVAWLEKELDIPITPVNIVDEDHDHYGADYGRWGYFQLDKYPVIEVTSLTFQYPSMDSSVEIDSQWICLVDGGAHGVLQVVPGQGSINDVLFIPGALMPHWSGPTGRLPFVWRASYRAGFEVGQIPDDIKHIIAMAASISVLNIAGDLLGGAGIATKSVSIPGLSQNIGTTSSATNAGYGARIIEYQKEIKEALPNLRRYYGKGTRMVVV